MSSGVLIGLSNVMYALLVSDPLTGTATYQTPVAISGAISAKLNPHAANDTMFADDGPYETATALGKITLDLNVADLPLEVQAVLMGHTMSGGVLVRKSSDVPPWVAIGFKTLKSNGSYRYTWLAKGKFALPAQDNMTHEDKVKFQTPTIQGNFVKRNCDNEWERHIDEDSTNYIASLGTNWFNNPYGGADTSSALSISSVAPANNATGVADTTTVVWTFNNALALTTVTAGNFMVIADAAETAVAGALTIDSTRTIVTFTPSASLTSGTVYRTIATEGVTDIYGHTLASPDVTKFTAL